MKNKIKTVWRLKNNKINDNGDFLNQISVDEEVKASEDGAAEGQVAGEG